MLRAIKAGIVTARTKAELERLEAERDRFNGGAAEAEHIIAQVAAILARAVDHYRDLVAALNEPPRHRQCSARAGVAALLGGGVRLMPGAGGLMAELTADYGGLVLVRLVTAGSTASGGIQSGSRGCYEPRRTGAPYAPSTPFIF